MTTIREYESSDWSAICAIHDLARPDELLGSCNPLAFVPIEEDEEVEDLKRSQKLVAENDGRIIGFVGLDGDYIAWLYVHPDFYRQGVGRALLQAGLERTQGAAWTIVLSENHPAIYLYTSMGFKEVHRFKSENAGYPCTCLRLERSAQDL